MSTGGVPPVLVAFGGLPGVGKTTLARAVARRLGAGWRGVAREGSVELK